MSLIGIDHELFEPSGEKQEDGRPIYRLRPYVWTWAARTGRPLNEWLWKDDLDTRKPDEMPPCDPSAS